MASATECGPAHERQLVVLTIGIAISVSSRWAGVARAHGQGQLEQQAGLGGLVGGSGGSGRVWVGWWGAVGAAGGAECPLWPQTRRSMVFAKQLRAVGDEFRSRYLNSTDAADRIPFEEDWTRMKVLASDA